MKLSTLLASSLSLLSVAALAGWAKSIVMIRGPTSVAWLASATTPIPTSE